MKLAWTRLALADLNQAHDYIVDESPSAAAGLIVRIEKALLTLRRHPALGRLGRVEGTRELVISGTPFIIPYRIQDQHIEILAVLHGARKWPDAL